MHIKNTLALLSIIGCLAAAPAFAEEEATTKFDRPPMPLKTPPPNYPDSMKGTGGMVSLVVIINSDGTVAEARVTKSSDVAFEAPSLEAISKWKFKPAEVNGQPVKCKITVPLRFNS